MLKHIKIEFIHLQCITVMIWLTGWLLGLPFSHPDDPFYGGAALNFAKSGEYQGIFTGYWVEQISRYSYPYPAIYPYVAGSWLKLWGSAPKAFSAFQMICGLISSLCLLHILKRLTFGYWATLGIGFCYFGFEIHRGFRPDIFSTALIMAGWLALMSKVRLVNTLGWASICLGVVALPYMALYALPLTLVGLYLNYKSSEKNYIYNTSIPLFVGIAVALFLNFLIDPIFFDRMAAYQKYAQTVFKTEDDASWYTAMHSAVLTLTNGWNLVIYSPALLWIAVNTALARRQKVYCVNNAWPIFCALGIALILTWWKYFTFLQESFWWTILVMAWVISPNNANLYIKYKAYKMAYILIAMAVAILPVMWLIVNLASLKEHLGKNEKLLLQASLRKKKEVYFDTLVWRYIYEMDAPKYHRCIHYGGEFKSNFWKDVVITRSEQIPEGVIVAVSNYYGGFIFLGVVPNYQPLKLMGRAFKSIPNWLDEVTILQKEDGKLVKVD